MNKYSLDSSILRKIQNKRIILTASSGRCGTLLLTKLLNLCHDVDAVHEPKPFIDDVWWRLRRHPELAYKYLIHSKIPTILEYPHSTYIETSHLLCKGFFEPLHALGVDFDLIILSRELRKVALSMYMLNDIPGRTKTGRRWYLDPTDKDNFTKIPKKLSRQLTDYQMCYWYCLEMEARKNHYYQLWQSLSRKVAKIALEDLTCRCYRYENFQIFIAKLDLHISKKDALFDYRMKTAIKYNNKNVRKHILLSKGKVKLPMGDITTQEKEVKNIIT